MTTSTSTINVPTSAAEYDALQFAYEQHGCDHMFDRCQTCDEMTIAMDYYWVQRDADHAANMSAIAHAEHRAFGECYQFEGDECSTCDDYFAQSQRTC